MKTTKNKLLKDFLKEHFDFKLFSEIGIYKPDVKESDYQKQAEALCDFFGFKTIYEYRFKVMRPHLSYYKGEGPENNQSIIEFKPNHED